MKGYVVIPNAGADPASQRHYVAAEDEAKALQLTASHLGVESNQLCILRTLATWEIEAFALSPDEIRPAP